MSFAYRHAAYPKRPMISQFEVAGGLIGGFFATNLGRSTILGVEGWRCAFHLVALVSIITSVLTMWLAVDPRRKLAVSPLSLAP